MTKTDRQTATARTESLQFTLDGATRKRFLAFLKASGASKDALIEQAVTEFLDREGSK